MEILFLIVSFFLCSASIFLLVKTRKSIRENKEIIARELALAKKNEGVH